MIHAMIHEAALFAILAHGDQKRKYNGLPYWTHCRDVAALVTARGGTSNMIAAAWLHDVLEDTQTTYADLSRRFGIPVADLVYELTDVYTKVDCPNWNRKKRKQLEADRTGRCSIEARKIKLCDIAHNDLSIEQGGDKFALIWRTEKAEMVRLILRNGDISANEWTPSLPF